MPLTAFSLLCQLSSGRFSQRDGLDAPKNRFKLAARSVLTLPSMLRWLEMFVANPALLALLRLKPSLAMKLHRPYLTQRLGTRAKLAILLQHYQLECSQFAAGPLQTLLADQPLTLASLVGRDEQTYTLVLTHDHDFDKEGELSLQLRNPQAVTLVTITATLCLQQGQRTLIVGGLQGPRRDEASSDTIRTVTKAFHGLFPKRVAMEAIMVLAQTLQIQRVLAVGKALHIYNSWRYRKHFEADYDSFWQALDATADGQGYFCLPQPIPRKTMEEIASKKRAEYQRRYALLDDLAAQIALNLK